MRNLCVVLACTLLFSASATQAAEYFIYQDPAGKIVLSNIPPPARAEVIQRHELQDVSDEAVRAALEREQAFWQRLKDEELAESNRKLAESNYRLTQAIITGVTLRDPEPEVVQVAVADVFPFERFRNHRSQPRGRLADGFRRHSRFR